MRRFNTLISRPLLFGVLLNSTLCGCSIAQEPPSDTGKGVTVAADGSGDFKTVQEAINAAPKGGTSRFVIRIKPGTYKEKLTVPKEKGPITFLGEDAATTILTFSDHAKTLAPDGTELGTSKSTSILIQAPDFHAENITFENSAGPVAQAVAVNVWSDRGVFRKCRFIGWQDTLLTNRNRQYFEDCYIIGSVDFIFGASTAWFERCHLHERRDAFITAASTPQELPYGYVFSNCTITGEPGVKTFLGRPWRPYASVTFLNTTMQEGLIRPEGWNNWPNPKNNEGKDNEKTARYSEYGSKTPDGELIDLSQRAAWTKRLTAEESAAITMDKVFGDWNPKTTVASSDVAAPSTGAGATPMIAATGAAPAGVDTVVPKRTGAVLTPQRIAALPPEQRTAWEAYLSRSAARLSADKAALDAEMKANSLAKPIAAPEGGTFKVVASTPAAWYASDEARRIADAMIAFQTASGGWSKAIDFSKGPRRPGMHWITRAGGWSFVGTFDNRATTEQMQFLSRVHEATKDPKYAASFLKGLDYIFDAQFPNGGWPQVYPLAGSYHDNATFNDDMMVHVLELLRDVAKGAPEYAFVNDARRGKARESVEKAVRFLVQSQVVQNGKRTVWGAQHDPLDLAPAQARAYELPALTGGESIGLVRFLMGIKNPSREVIEAVQGAVAWFDASKITGIEVMKKPDTNMSRGFDTVVVENPNALPIWGRFYELGTNRPIFVGRDGVVKYTLAEIDPERRTGYAWYQTGPRGLLERDYPKWQAKWAPQQNVLKP